MNFSKFLQSTTATKPAEAKPKKRKKLKAEVAKIKAEETARPAPWFPETVAAKKLRKAKEKRERLYLKNHP